MKPGTSSKGKSASSEAANKSAPSITDKKNAEKRRLQKDIQELRCIIKQAEWSLEVLRFKNVERMIKLKDSKISHFGRIVNVEVQLQNDLYRFAGFRCVKFVRGETVFNFTSANEQQKNNLYAVQIFVKNGKGSLGKWVMPMSIDINEILTKTPIDKLKNLTSFIKNCKHNIDCYTIRQEQFLSLKEYISPMKYYALHSNLGYMQINLELYGVYDREDDKYIDLIIYLLYHSNEARPHKVKIDTTAKKELSDEISQRLKVHLREFKISDLRSAFDQLFMKRNSVFTWIREDDNESLLEINNTSISDEEGFLEQLHSERKKSLRKAEKRRKLKDKWINKRQKPVSKITSSAENSSDDVYSEVEVPHTKTSHQIPVSEKESEVVASTSKQQKEKNKDLLEDTPMNKSKIKLKQTKLDFQATQSANPDKVYKDPLQSKSYVKLGNKNLKMAKLVTSTPLHPRVSSKLISTMEIDNITEIGSPPKKTAKDNANHLDRDNSQTRNVTPKKKNQKSLKKSPRLRKLSSKTHIVKSDKSITKRMKK